MVSYSPTLEGFRAAFRRPSLTLAEMAWRWTVGAVAGALFLFSSFEFLDSLTVAPRDSVLLRTRQPLLIARALAHILRGSLERAVFASLLAVIALAVLWVVAACLGRVITMSCLLSYFRSGVDRAGSYEPPMSSAAFRSLIWLSVLRMAVTLAALLAFVGAMIVAGLVSSGKNPQPELAANIFMLLAVMICGTWFVLNWLLSLAGIFTVRDGTDALSSISAAVSFARERGAAVAGVSGCTGLAHLVAFCVALAAMSFPLAFVHVAPARPVIAIVAVIALGYFAFADWLYIARFAGYVCIMEAPAALPVTVASSVPPPTDHMDRDEPILGDVPGRLAET
jgi:hypothetical protein